MTRRAARQGLRYLGWMVVGLLLLIVVAAGSLWLALHSRSFRQTLLERVGRLVQQRAGLELRLGDFALRPATGEIELQELSLGKAGEAAALEVARLRVDLGLRSLLSETLVVQQLEAERWRVSSERLLELSPREPPGEAPAGRRLEIRQLALTDGSIDGGPPPETVASWLDGWSASSIGVRGAWVGGRLALELRQATVVLARPEGAALELSLAGALEGPDTGPFRLEQLTLVGEGLDGEISGLLGLEESQPLEASFRLTLEPGPILGLPGAGGRLEAVGEVDLRSRSGRLQLAGSELSARLLGPWMGESVPAPLDLEQDRFSLTADLTLGPGSLTSAAGSADLAWLRGAETVATAGLESLSAGESGADLRLAVKAELLPGAAGSRRFEGRLRLPDLGRLAEAELEEGRWRLMTTDLAADLGRLRAIWPGLLPARLDELPVGGELEARGHVEGPLGDLAAGGIVDWRPGDGSSLSLQAEGHPQRLDGRAELVFNDVELSHWVSDLSGRISGHGRGGASQGSWEAAIELAGSGLGATGSEPWVEELSLALRADDRRIVVDSLQAIAADRVPLEGEAVVTLGSQIGGEVELRIAEALGPVEEAELALELRGGTLSAASHSRLVNGAEAVFQAALPLGSVAHFEQLAAALSFLPQTLDPGLLTAEWRVGESDWRAVLADLGRDPGVEIRAGLEGRVELDPADPAAGRGTVSLQGLEVEKEGETWAATEPWLLRLAEGRLELESARLQTDDQRVELTAELLPELPLRQARADLRLRRVPSGLQAADVEMELAEGVLRLRVPRIEVAGPPGWLEADLPLASLAEIWPPLAELPLEQSAGPVEARWSLPAADWGSWLPTPGEEPFEGELSAGLEGRLTLDPSVPMAAEGEFVVSGLSLSLEGHRAEAVSDLRLRLSDGRLELEPFRWLADGQALDLAGSAELEPAWRPGDAFTGLVRSLEVESHGTLVAAVLNPFLAGGIAEGLLEVDLEAAGSLSDLTGTLKLSGEGASILFLSPYVAKVEDPEMVFEVADGKATLRSGRLRLNEGEVELWGSLAATGVDLGATLEDLRLRLDHGLLTLLDGRLRLALDAEGAGRLEGEIVVDQGTLTRPINVDRDLISQLLLPVDLTGTEASELERIELDLTLTTRRGVRISNNVADLSVRWQPIAVRGNLAQPVLDGQMEIEPGGRVFLFGQTVRVDRGSLTFPGEPGAEAVLDLETTSSLKDPSIARLSGDDPLAPPAETVSGLERAEAVATGVATFYGERIASRLGEALGGTEINFSPIFIFGETDPGARLTIARDFSSYVTLAASLDLRNAERQTYLLDAHDFPFARSLTGQVFTADEGTEGATLQQRLRFGSVRRTAAAGPRIRRFRPERPPGVSKRGLRRALGLEKGDRTSTEVLFVAEVEAGEYLRRRGYPDARVELTTLPVSGHPDRVDLELAVRPGPRVRFQFEGESIPGTLRRSITALYRADFYEPVALDEMRAQTVRVLRSRGFLQPVVDIEVTSDETEKGEGEKTVTVRTAGGRRVPLETLVVEGVDEEEQERIRRSFASRVQKMELAAGEPAAERRLLSVLRSLGYPEPRIEMLRLSDNGEVLRVEVDPGRALRVEQVTIAGIEPAEAERLAELVGVGRGDVARRDRIAAGALAIEEHLASQGYREARVRSSIGEAEPAEGPAVDLTYEVDPGRRYTVADTRFEGLRATRPRWARSVTGIETGAVLSGAEIAEAQRRLYETGLFSTVNPTQLPGESGEAEVLFQVEERPRFLLAYGARWDSEEGASAVLDAQDRNFLGRGLTLGLRALYADEDESLRLSAGIPRLFGTRGGLELFASAREGTEEEVNPDTGDVDATDFETFESTLQFVYPFGRYLTGRVYGRYRDLQLVQMLQIDGIPFLFESRTEIPFLGTQWIFDSRDSELILPQGLFASADLSGTGEFLDSDFKWLRFFGQVNVYRRLGAWRGRLASWAQSLRLGLLEGFDREPDRQDRFSAGGQYSVRGYPTESLGPVDEALRPFVVRPLGGRTLFVLNEELRFQILGPVHGLLFFDAGNVWAETAEFDLDLAKSVGLGVRAVTPIGLLRLDWALPLDRREGDPSSRLYFGFGNTF